MSSKMQIVLPELHVRYLHIMGMLGSKHAKEALDRVNRTCEVHIPLNGYFHEEYHVRSRAIEKFAKEHKAGKILNGGTYHGMISIASPFDRKNVLVLANSQDYEKNIAGLRGQLNVVRQLNDATDVPGGMLVVHLDSTSCENEDEGKIVTMFEQVLDDMERTGVTISIEEDLGGKYYNCFGSKFENLARVVDQVNEHAKNRGLESRLGITHDFSHALINAMGNFGIVKDEVERFADYINYAHLNHPRSLENLRPDSLMKPLPTGFMWQERYLWSLRKGPDNHGRVYDLESEQEAHEIIRMIFSKTRIQETGRVNIELSPPLTYMTRFRNSGANPTQSLRSIDAVQRLISEALENE